VSGYFDRLALTAAAVRALTVKTARIQRLEIKSFRTQPASSADMCLQREQDFTLRGGRGRASLRPLEVHHPVRLPGGATVERKGLLPSRRASRHAGPDETDEDGAPPDPEGRSRQCCPARRGSAGPPRFRRTRSSPSFPRGDAGACGARPSRIRAGSRTRQRRKADPSTVDRTGRDGCHHPCSRAEDLTARGSGTSVAVPVAVHEPSAEDDTVRARAAPSKARKRRAVQSRMAAVLLRNETMSRRARSGDGSELRPAPPSVEQSTSLLSEGGTHLGGSALPP